MQRYKDYRSICFWSWNDKLEKEELKRQIHWLKENGIGGYFMHARSGLQTEYMSKEWMECIETCTEEGESLGMESWAYDENGWPSGFAGGKLLEAEANRDKYILTKTGAFDPDARVSYLLKEEEIVRVQDSISSLCKGDGTDALFTNKLEGEYLNLYIETGVSTVDILNPSVVRQFMDLTHEKYKQYFGDKLSEKLSGFFTDEPQYYRWYTPYTVMLEEYWKEKFNEDILDALGLLFVEKKGYRKFRYRYWKAMQELMLNNFAKQVYEWCDENGVQLTGHYIEEMTMGLQMTCCAGMMPFYEYEHMPGIDCLGKDTKLELPAKQVGSVAAQLGKKQVLTETFACCGWDVTPIDLRRIAGFQYVNGVNRTCQHLVPYSQRGNRKYDHPAHYYDDNPWIPEGFKEFNDYFTKLGYFLGEGEQHINVAMLHPIRSTYFDYKRELEEEGYGIAHLDRELQRAYRTLSSRGIDYHFLDETLLAKHGFVDGTFIGCGQCKYEYLVLPSLVTMDKTTEKLLRQYVEQGGKVLLLGEKPEYLEAEEYTYDYLETNITLEDIIAAQPYRVEHLDTEIYSTYRTMGSKEYLYIINASDSMTQVQTYDLGPEIHSFVKVDLNDMSKTNVPLTITLKPGEDAFLYPSSERVSQEKVLTPYTLRFENAKVTVKDNYMPVDYIRYSKDGKEYSKPWPCPALFEKLLKEQYEGPIYLRYEFEIDSVPEQLYLRAEKSNEMAAWLNGHELCHVQKDGYVNVYDIASYACEGINEYTIQVDWHENDNVYFALFGENVTESLKNCIVYDTELQPIELIGNFGVYPKTGYYEGDHPAYVRGDNFYIGKMPRQITEPSVEGFPFLKGEISFVQKVVFDTTDVLLEIPGDYQLAYVKVNEKQAGRLLFDRRLDISNLAVIGENQIEVRFVLSNRNLMGPHHMIGYKNDCISPWSFEFSGCWEEDYCEDYHADYDIKKLFN